MMAPSSSRTTSRSSSGASRRGGRVSGRHRYGNLDPQGGGLRSHRAIVYHPTVAEQEKVGRPFERLVAAVQKKLDPGSQVHSPQPVVGKSGSRISLDVAVVGKVGSTDILVAVEAKDYDGPVGVEQVRAFCLVRDDARAHHGIMVAPRGFTRDALLTAAQYGIDTCVLRPARDGDWENLIQHASVDVILVKHVFREAAIELADGRKIPVPEHGRVPLVRDVDDLDSFEGVVNGGIANHPEFDNHDVFIHPNEPLWFPELGGERVAVARLLCRREQVEAARQNILISSPSDYIFVKQMPDGEVDERHFLELKELEDLARSFRR
jgi:hypothetical protein